MKIRKSLVLLLLVVQCIQLTGQLYKEMKSLDSDSLRKVIPTLGGTEQIDAMTRLALAWCHDLPDSSIATAHAARTRAEKINYRKGSADANLYAGNAWFYLDSIRPATLHFLEALRIYEDLEPCREMGFALMMLQGLNMITGRRTESLRYGVRASELFESLSEHWYRIRTIITVGAVLDQQVNKLDTAIATLQYTLGLLNEHLFPDLMIANYQTLGYAWERKFNQTGEKRYLFKALDAFRKKLEIESGTGQPVPEKALTLISIGETYYKLDPRKYADSSYKYASEALELARELDHTTYMTMSCFLTMAGLEHHKGNSGKAVKMLEEGLRTDRARWEKFSPRNYAGPFGIFYEKVNYLDALRQTYDTLYSIYMEIGDYEHALEYFIQREASDRDVTLLKNRELVAMLEAESENEKTARQIATLHRDREINALQAAQSRSLALGMGILLVVLLFMGVLFIRQNRLRSEHKSTLLEQKLLRLQMNPHFIFNALSNIHSLMNPREVGRAAEYLGSFSRLLRTSLESSREDYVLLEDEVSSINSYLELQQLRYDGKFDYSVEVGPDINLEEAAVPPMLIQPFIENAIEHGLRHKKGNGHIQVRFSRENKQVVCEVEDDGVGREKAWKTEYAEKGKHRSLATEIISDRIAILNRRLRGKIRLDIIDKKSDSEEAMGTLVRLDLPYLLD